MAIIGFFIQLASGVILLLFSVQFLRVGVERLWSAQITNSLSADSGRSNVMLKGAFLGFLMQGSMVVILMAAGMAASGSIPILTAVLIGLGADLGSAVAVRILSLPVSALGPLAVLVGGWMYLNGSRFRTRNIGRFLMGLGLIFLALAVIRTTVVPLRELVSDGVIFGYLNADVVTAAVAGFVLTVLMHSSLAAILTALTAVTDGVLQPVAGLGFVLGCNIGSAVLPVWLVRNLEPVAAAVTRTVGLIRAVLAILCILGLLLVEPLRYLIADIEVRNAILIGHLAFNGALLLTAPMCPIVLKVLSTTDRPSFPSGGSMTSAKLDDPDLLVSSLKGGAARMLDILADMVAGAMSEQPDEDSIASLEKDMNDALSGLTQDYSACPDLEEDVDRELQQVMNYAIKVERCGDGVSGKFLRLYSRAQRGEITFSKEGGQEIAGLAREVRTTIVLAKSVLWTGDIAQAHALAERKQRIASLEEGSRSSHLDRIREGDRLSLGTSDIHLELIGALKEVNSKLATIGYAVLEQEGALRRTRLKKNRLKQHRS